MAVCDSEDDGVDGVRVCTVSGSSAADDGSGVAAVGTDDVQRPLLWTTNLCLALVAAPSLFSAPQEFVALVLLAIALDVGVTGVVATTVVGATFGREPWSSPLSDTPNTCNETSELLPFSSSS